MQTMNSSFHFKIHVKINFLAYCNDIVVGAVCCRIDLADNQRRLYIMTLGVLAKYRELGLGNIHESFSLKSFFVFVNQVH
jgi:hypothetical protein